MQFTVHLSFAAVLLATTAAAGQSLVSPDWLAARLRDQTVVVPDIRPQARHAAAHIPGAVATDYETIGWWVKRPDGAGDTGTP